MEPNELLSQLIGLARATDGSEHLITPAAVAVVTAALKALHDGSPEAHIAAVIEAKRAMVPNCFTCAAPCGRTSPFDLSLLKDDSQSVRAAKQELVRLLTGLAAADPDEATARDWFFLGLIAIGTQPISESALDALVSTLRTLSAGKP